MKTSDSSEDEETEQVGINIETTHLDAQPYISKESA